MKPRRPRWAALARRPAGSLALAVAALAGIFAAGAATAPAGPVDGGHSKVPVRLVDVARATAACPDPVTDGSTTTRVTLAAPGPVLVDESGGAGGAGTAGSEDQGQAAVVSPARPDVPVVRAVAPGTADAPAPPGAGDRRNPLPLVARATGGSAPGMLAAQLTRSTNATMRGLAGTTCAASGTEFWFVGSGAVVGQRGRVYLTNPEPSAAVVDIELFGPDGPVPSPDAEGVTVAPGEQEVRLLDALAPGTTRFAVHVRVRQGRVSAAVRDLQVQGLTPLGADWVPPAAAPALRVHVPGVPGGTGERHLQVVAPGESDAIVRVRLVADSGAFAPAGLDVIEVPAGTVSDVDIAPFTGGEAVTVELVSDAPVTAGVLTRLAPPEDQLGDIAYSAAALELGPQTPGVIGLGGPAEDQTTSLLLTAPGEAATVEILPLPPATSAALQVTVPAGSQVPVALASLAQGPLLAVRVRPLPGSGPVLGVRLIEELEMRGPMITSSPIQPGRYAVPVPRVVADLSTGLRRR